MIVKLMGSTMVLAAGTIIGMILAKDKVDRVKQLRELISALNMLEIEIKFGLSTLPEAFMKVSKNFDDKIGKLFEYGAQLFLHDKITGFECWKKTICWAIPSLSLNKEDEEILLTLGSSLGEVDTENQLKAIRLVVEQLKHQEIRAQEERIKEEKMFRSLGILMGLAVVIILF